MVRKMENRERTIVEDVMVERELFKVLECECLTTYVVKCSEKSITTDDVKQLKFKTKCFECGKNIEYVVNVPQIMLNDKAFDYLRDIKLIGKTEYEAKELFFNYKEYLIRTKKFRKYKEDFDFAEFCSRSDDNELAENIIQEAASEIITSKGLWKSHIFTKGFVTGVLITLGIRVCGILLKTIIK